MTDRVWETSEASGIGCGEADEVLKRAFSFPSAKGDVSCHALSWQPVGSEPKAVVQIVHGMVEYIDRYDRFARDLCAAGFAVIGHDHIGHGDSVNFTDDWGCMPMKGGDRILVEDVESLRILASGSGAEGLPYFLMGHSMGSFVARCYAQRYAAGLSGLILEGTGNPPRIASRFGRALCSAIAAFRGPAYRSKLVNGLADGAYSKYSDDYETPIDWITRDRAVIQENLSNPKSSFTFSVSGYHTLLSLTSRCVSRACVEGMPKDLPLLIASGEEDPVGDGGRGPAALYAMCVNAGMRDVSLKLYPEARHELHNEIDREVFIADVVAWMDAHIRA